MYGPSAGGLGFDYFGWSVVEQLLRGYVDCDGNDITGVHPLAQIAASGPHNPTADVYDQPAVLGNLNEAGRRDITVLRVAPAKQCLDAAIAADSLKVFRCHRFRLKMAREGLLSRPFNQPPGH
jgi:hypothetical protein